MVWFKHDLRIDDHPGLAAAVSEPRRPVVPLYVFDRRILAGNVGCVGARRPIRLSVGGMEFGNTARAVMGLCTVSRASNVVPKLKLNTEHV